MVSLVVLSSLLFMQGDRVLTGPLAHGQQVRPAQVGDLASFWAAGRMFLLHQNPYDPKLLADLAEQHDLNQVFVTTNPPILLPIVSPLAIVPFPVACTVWFVGQLIICYLIMLSICHLVERHWFGVARLMLLLPATWDCMLMGQWSLLVLLGIVRCERCLQRDQPLRAGLWLALVALKPHLVMVYLLVPGDRVTVRYPLPRAVVPNVATRSGIWQHVVDAVSVGHARPTDHLGRVRDRATQSGRDTPFRVPCRHDR